MQVLDISNQELGLSLQLNNIFIALQEHFYFDFPIAVSLFDTKKSMKIRIFYDSNSLNCRKDWYKFIST